MSVDVLCKVSFKKAFYLLAGPFILIFIGYMLLSQRPVSQVMTVENLTTPTPFHPVPLLSIAALIFYISAVLYRAYVLYTFRDKYLWIDRGILMLCGKPITSLRDIRADGMTWTKSGLVEYLMLTPKAGGSIPVAMAFGKYEKDKLVCDLARTIAGIQPDREDSGDTILNSARR